MTLHFQIDSRVTWQSHNRFKVEVRFPGFPWKTSIHPSGDCHVITSRRNLDNSWKCQRGLRLPIIPWGVPWILRGSRRADHLCCFTTVEDIFSVIADSLSSAAEHTHEAGKHHRYLSHTHTHTDRHFLTLCCCGFQVSTTISHKLRGGCSFALWVFYFRLSVTHTPQTTSSREHDM